MAYDKCGMFKITLELIKDVFGLQCAPDAMTHISDNLIVQDSKRELFMNNIGAPDSCSRVSMMNRILDLITSWTLRPVLSKYSFICKEELWFIHYIKPLTLVDLPYFMFSDIKKIVVGTRSNLISSGDSRLNANLAIVNKNAWHLDLLQDIFEGRFDEKDHAIISCFNDVDQHI
ncbi:Uncharacterized protein TCM_003875 [Theobroma cacao]|uniref:Uncharacterized protein n=1 Tax=Theobroma cacao TaxID=3641 RepID=A0A061DQC4_THECC|nr:Uncharacterized protein TCM_003875 [Theobroma cacao]